MKLKLSFYAVPVLVFVLWLTILIPPLLADQDGTALERRMSALVTFTGVLLIVVLVIWSIGVPARRRLAILRNRPGVRWVHTARREPATTEGVKALENGSERFGGTLGLTMYYGVIITESTIEFWSGDTDGPFRVSLRALSDIARFETGQIELKAAWWPACIVVFKGDPHIQIPMILTGAWEVWPLGRRSVTRVTAELNLMLVSDAGGAGFAK